MNVTGLMLKSHYTDSHFYGYSFLKTSKLFLTLILIINFNFIIINFNTNLALGINEEVVLRAQHLIPFWALVTCIACHAQHKRVIQADIAFLTVFGNPQLNK